MLGCPRKQALGGDGVAFAYAVPGEITEGFACLQLQEVAARDDKKLNGAALSQSNHARSRSHGNALPLVATPHRRTNRKAFGILGNGLPTKAVSPADPAGKKGAPTGGPMGRVALIEKPLKPVKVPSELIAPDTPQHFLSRPAIGAVSAPRENRLNAAGEACEEDKENKAPSELPSDHEQTQDEGLQGGESPVAAGTHHRERDGSKLATSGPEAGLEYPIPLSIAKGFAIPGVRFREGPLGELSVVHLESTKERVSIPSKGIPNTEAKATHGGIPHLLTLQGREEVKSYLSNLQPVHRDPAIPDYRQQHTEDELVNMFLGLHFGDDWLACDTVISRCQPQASQPLPTVLPEDAAPVHRHAKRYCASSSYPDGHRDTHQHPQQFKRPLTPVRAHGSAQTSTCPIPNQRAGNGLLGHHGQVGSLVGDMSRSAGPTRLEDYGTSAQEFLALSELHVRCADHKTPDVPIDYENKENEG